MIPKFYTVEEIAEAAQIDAQFIRRDIKNKQLEAFNFGRAVRISEKAVADYIESKSTFSKDMKIALAEQAEATKRSGVAR